MHLHLDFSAMQTQALLTFREDQPSIPLQGEDYEQFLAHSKDLRHKRKKGPAATKLSPCFQ